MKYYVYFLLIILIPLKTKAGPVKVETENGNLELIFTVMYTGSIYADGCTDEKFGGIFNVGDTLSLDLSNISAFLRSLYGNSVYMTLDYDMFRYSYEQCLKSECTEHDYEESIKEFDCMTDWFDNAVELTIGECCTVEIRYCVVKGFFFFTSHGWDNDYMPGVCTYLPKYNIFGHGEICVPLAPVSYFKCEYDPFISSKDQKNMIRNIHRKPEMLKVYESSHSEYETP